MARLNPSAGATTMRTSSMAYATPSEAGRQVVSILSLIQWDFMVISWDFIGINPVVI